MISKLLISWLYHSHESSNKVISKWIANSLPSNFYNFQQMVNVKSIAISYNRCILILSISSRNARVDTVYAVGYYSPAGIIVGGDRRWTILKVMMLILFECLVSSVISLLTILNHGLTRHLKWTGQLTVAHLKVHSKSQIICVNFTETHLLQHWKCKAWPSHSQCQWYNLCWVPSKSLGWGSKSCQSI